MVTSANIISAITSALISFETRAHATLLHCKAWHIKNGKSAREIVVGETTSRADSSVTAKRVRIFAEMISARALRRRRKT